MGKTKRCACPEANLLPVTKFVGNGLLIKCLGQVDLPNAPLDIVSPYTCPSPAYHPGFLCIDIILVMFHVKHL